MNILSHIVFELGFQEWLNWVSHDVAVEGTNNPLEWHEDYYKLKNFGQTAPEKALSEHPFDWWLK